MVKKSKKVGRLRKWQKAWLVSMYPEVKTSALSWQKPTISWRFVVPVEIREVRRRVVR